MNSLRFGCGLLLAVSLVACGDDDGGGSDAGTNGSEGSVCGDANDCDDGLACVPRGADPNDPLFCARGCERHDQCEDDERCVAYCDPTEPGCTENPGHCSHVTNTAWDECGSSIVTSCGVTAGGAELSCVTTDESGSLGFCAALCSLAAPTTCTTSEICSPDVLASTTTGVCAVPVARGGACDSLAGEVCGLTDICADLENPGITGTCRQFCGGTLPACEGDTTCTPFALLGDQPISACFPGGGDQDAGM